MLIEDSDESIINKNRILKFIKSGGIPVITGFQGINLENRITTLGRGGTDASAIMFAKFFNAKRCLLKVEKQILMCKNSIEQNVPTYIVCSENVNKKIGK